MCTADIIIIACFIPFLIQGLTKGFIVQVMSTISVFVGVWLSFRFSGMVCDFIQPYLEVSDKVLHVIAFTIIMAAAILGFYLIGRVLHGLVRIVMLGWLDRLLGLALSAVLGTMVIGVGIMLFNTLNTTFGFVDEGVLDSSVAYTTIRDIAYAVFPYFKELLFKQ